MLRKYTKDLLIHEGEVAQKAVGINEMGILAQLHKQHGELFKHVELHSEVVWINTHEYDSKQLKAFQDGVESVTKFMHQCAQEVDVIQKKQFEGNE